MTELEFKSLANQGYNRIPLIAEAFADLETPLTLYLKLAQSQEAGKNTFLLESVVGGERFGRYSFIGLPARTLVRNTGRVTEVVKNGEVIETVQGNPLEFIGQYQARFKVALRPGMPRFCGGLAAEDARPAGPQRHLEALLVGLDEVQRIAAGTLDHFAVGHDLGDRLGTETARAQQGAGGQADEAVAAEALAADDRLEQEAQAPAALGVGQLQIQRQRGFEVRECLGDERNAVIALQRKALEFEFGDQGEPPQARRQGAAMESGCLGDEARAHGEARAIRCARLQACARARPPGRCNL